MNTAPQHEPMDSPWTPPSNVEAEKSLLGAIFANPKAYEDAADHLRPEHFYVPRHGLVYAEAARLIELGNIANPVTMKAFFEGPDFEDVGGVKFSVDLAQSVVSIINAKEYGRLIHEAYRQRELVAIGQETAARASKEDPEVVLEALERELTALSGEEITDPSAQMTNTLKAIEAALRGDTPPGHETGLIDLDKKLGRLRPQSLYVIAGRPSMGKSALALNIAEHIADEVPVLFFSLEMSGEDNQLRRVCTATNIDTQRLLNGDVSTIEMEQIVMKGQALEAKPLIIDDTGAVSVQYIRRQARRQKRKSGLGLIVVDYVQLMSGEGDTRDQVIGGITSGLKALAKDLHIPVIALSQLNRGLEARDDKTPRLSDLRESGAIEQDADTVMFVYREEYYLERAKPCQGENETDQKFNEKTDRWLNRLARAKNLAEIIIPKNRQGAIGATTCLFHGAAMRFATLHHKQEDLI